MLRFYFDRIIKIIKVHSGIKFTASPYLSQYIENNTNKRTIFKKDDVKKNFYKLMNNSLYGKKIEISVKRSDIRLLNDPDQAIMLAEKPHCVDFRLFSPDLIGIEMRKCRHFINKPFSMDFVYLCGASIKCIFSMQNLRTYLEIVCTCYILTQTHYFQFFVDVFAKELIRDESM